MTSKPITKFWTSAIRVVPPVLLAVLITLYPTTARAQNPEEEGGDKKSDDPVPSYLYFGAISSAVIFLVCKSARR